MKNEAIIEKTAMVTAKEVVSELKKQGLLKDKRQTPFQKTETLLYNYKNFKAAIEDKLEQIKEIELVGLPKRSPSITSFSSSGSNEVKSESDKVEEKISAIDNSIQDTRRFISIIDAALDSLKKDTYFDIIRLKYFEGMNGEDIAEYYQVDVRTIARNKNRLINKLQIRLFSDEVIGQLFHN
ncbi:sigma-70 family RNA polymerase sigma factor [Alkalicella caledoniensis]|uniref:Sigma-70 family RNA polymerase sigma factor n=1 Tax=Alkalicella caledoniensis TaxID=2731377 RepID=A0A7G9W8C4_ALKCA|nr:hypothetical protein [Alkalicella caledoniensis]QNO14936.1 sigma-70 family RNA polymerase sigma factor [Alkalicella caledoniensis]